MSEDLPFRALAEAFQRMEEVTSRNALTEMLIDLFKRSPPEILDEIVYLMQGKLYPDFVGVELGVGEKLLLRSISLATGLPQDRVEDLYKRLGDVGRAAEEAVASRKQVVLFREQLTVRRVYSTLERVAKMSGEGAQDAKVKLLASLFNDAEPLEARYLARIVMGRLRLGVADYTVLDALAVAFGGSKEAREIVERAYNVSSDLGLVARTAASQGLAGLQSIGITVGRPLRPMLAERLSSPQEILEKIGGTVAAEYKFDGERMQVHRKGDSVMVFSRRLENITSHYPDVVEIARSGLRSNEIIVEGEGVAFDADTGEFLPFQELMHRRRKYGIEKAMEEYPVSLYLFDLIYADGVDYTTKPYTERRRKLEELVSPSDRINLAPMIMTKDPEEIERFMMEAIERGCEGLVVKDPNSVYRAGAREWSWIKLKREYRSEMTDTVDLVIVGAFHGRGKRAGVYGAYLLAAYDPDSDTFKTVCKVGTGFTDEDLRNFHEMLQQYVISHRHPRVDSRMEADVWFVPQVVIEVLAAEITLSPIHTAAWGAVRPNAGLALRFPRYTGRLRSDKGPEDATTVKELVEMYRSQVKKIEEPASSEGT
ncbi:MAG: ATP-dependent DNA ligase [Nitrososphaeria archaeon]